ncbi:MAG: hypothetical protein ABIH26_05665 [Candidatus Eisenbacteria bacterium]
MDAHGRFDGSETPHRSRKIRADADEVFDFLSEKRNLPLWWGPSANGEGDDELHMDVEAGSRTLHLRWGSPGMWRHMATTVVPEKDASRVTIRFVPVPGCDGVCLDREILRARGQLGRLARLLRGRAHLIDSEGYWL